MAGDRHAGVKRCLHRQERREFISTGDFGQPLERCLDCRAVRQQLRAMRGFGIHAAWGPWVSAGEQVKRALLAQGSSAGLRTADFDVSDEWADLVAKKR